MSQDQQEHRAVKGQVDQMKQETELTQQLTQAGPLAGQQIPCQGGSSSAGRWSRKRI